MPHRARLALFFACALIAGPMVVLAETDDLRQPLRVSPDGHFLMQPNGEPFFWLGDTAWELFHRLDRDEAEAYLKDRAAKGFTVIQVVATGKVDPIGLDAPNRHGEVPFIARDPARPNPRYFEFVDWVIDRAVHHGIRVALLPVWGQTLVSGGAAVQVFTSANAETYGRWLGQRYRDKGIIWVLGGDVAPLWPVTASTQRPVVVNDYRPVYDAMAKGIEAGAAEVQFLTYHPSAGSVMGTALPRTSLYFGDREWLDMNMIQSSHAQRGPGAEQGGDYLNSGFVWNGAFNYLPIAAEYRSNPTRPIIDAEPGFEDHPIWGPSIREGGIPEVIGFWQPHQVRGALYRALFAGASGHTYGNFSVWDFFDAARVGKQKDGSYDRVFAKFNRVSWQQALGAAGAGQMRHAKALLLSRPYFGRIPDQSVIIGEAGVGEAHIGATRDRSGAYVLVYLPQGQSVTVDLNKLSGTNGVGWWLDPRSGKATRIEGALPTNQPRRFTPPDSGPDRDWVLVLDDASNNFPIPGSATS